MTHYRIYEIDDRTGIRSVAGWGDHVTKASALYAVGKWGRIIGLMADDEHDAFDLLLVPHGGLPATQIAIEPIRNGKSWPTC